MSQSVRVLIEARHLDKSYGRDAQQTQAYTDLNFAIPEGQFCAILGPSGCGKTTLLRTLAGLEKYTAGELEFHFSATSSRPVVSMVFQDADLFPWMTLERNIQFILENNPNVQRNQIGEITRSYLAKVGLSKFARHYPSQVSGGMRQRVSLARSFANNPDLLLMDEPFVYLDYQSRLLLHEMLLNIWRESGKTIVFVTHDIEEAVFLADRILLMSAHPGTIARDMPIEFARPRNLTELRKLPAYVDTVNALTDWIRKSNVFSNDDETR